MTATRRGEQIAFADVILLNKIDLVTKGELDQLEARIRSMNAAAKIYRTKNAVVEMDRILNVGGFDLDRAMEVDPQFMEPEYPFEWAGVYNLSAGTHELVLQEGPDPTMKVALVHVNELTDEALKAAVEPVVMVFSDDEHGLSAGGALQPSGQLIELNLTADELRFDVQIDRPRRLTRCLPSITLTNFKHNSLAAAPLSSQLLTANLSQTTNMMTKSHRSASQPPATSTPTG